MDKVQLAKAALDGLSGLDEGHRVMLLRMAATQRWKGKAPEDPRAKLAEKSRVEMEGARRDLVAMGLAVQEPAEGAGFVFYLSVMGCLVAEGVAGAILAGVNAPT